MDLILRNSSFEKKKPIVNFELSEEYGLYGSASNDFKLSCRYDGIIKKGDILTVNGTEWGGVVSEIVIENDLMSISGKSFRGLMELAIVNPFSTLTLMGTDCDIVKKLFELSTLNFKIMDSGNTVKKTVIIPVKSNLLKAIDIVLNEFGETMILKASSNIELSLNLAKMHRYDYSQNQLTLSEGGLIPTGLHALGKVNGVEESVSVFAQKNGEIGTSRFYKNFEAYEIAEDISDNCASRSELESIASGRLRALRTSTFSSVVDVKIDDAQIGDGVNVSILKYSRNVRQKIIGKKIEMSGQKSKQTLITGG